MTTTKSLMVAVPSEVPADSSSHGEFQNEENVLLITPEPYQDPYNAATRNALQFTLPLGPEGAEEGLPVSTDVPVTSSALLHSSIRNMTENSAVPDTVDTTSHSKIIFQNPYEQNVLFFNNTFRCPIGDCTKVFTNTRRYRVHRVIFHKLPRYRCIVCSEPFDDYKHLVCHMKCKTHKVQCAACTHCFQNPHDAVRHFSQKHKVLVCPHCKEHIYGKLSFKNHIETFHGAEENCFFSASSFVETALNSSFCELDPQDEANLVLNRKPRDYDTIRNAEVDESTALPDSTSVHYNVMEQSYPSAVFEDLSSRSCIEPDIIEVENELSDLQSQSMTRKVEAERQLNMGSPRLLQNPFFEKHRTCPVMFGPGADDLLHETSAQTFSSMRDHDKGQWIGHDVHAYQSMVEKNNKTFRYVCGKCSRSFKSKEQLKRHVRVHEYICKQCVQIFDSVEELKVHEKEHSAKMKTLECAYCGHSLCGLKSLMVHEMGHRLDEAFKRKMEESMKIETSSKVESAFRECKICKVLNTDFPAWIRHGVIHDYPEIWESYAAGRVFKGIITEEERNNFKKPVEAEVIAKWKEKSKRSNILQEQISDKKKADSDNLCSGEDWDDSHCSDTQDCESESDVVSENDSIIPEGIKVALNGWMSYWESYLGLDDSPPSWVVPILKDLQSKWKLYRSEENDLLYKQMDQIAILVRAQKNESSASEGPKVILQKLSDSYITKMTSGPQFNISEAKVVCERVVAQDVEMPGERVGNKQTSEKETHSSFLQPSLSLCTPDVPSEVNPDIHANSREMTPVLSKESGIQRRNLFTRSTSILQPSTTASCSIEKSKSRQQSISVSPKTIKTGLKRKRLQSERTNENQQSPIPERQDKTSDASLPSLPKMHAFGLSHPVVVLQRLSWPLDSRDPPHISSNSVAEVMPTISSPQEMKKWIENQEPHLPIPSWASTLIENVASNNSLSRAQKFDKLHQIISLIKVEHGVASVKFPVVHLAKDC